MKYDIKKVYAWPFPAQLLLIGGVFIVILYLGYTFNLSSFREKIRASGEVEQDLKHQLQVSLQTQADISQQIAEVPQLKALLDKWQANIVTGSEVPQLLSEILRHDTDSNVKITKFNPDAEQKDSIYPKIPVEVHLLGTYDQIARYISNLANMSHLVVIKDLSIMKDPQTAADENESSKPLNSNVILTAIINLEIYKRE